uniref:AHJR-like domain-containing protein n=1 Tax=Heterorhabditis bacteriophora TaxID=37862 RepID=A0A1I7WKD0_HETBA
MVGKTVKYPEYVNWLEELRKQGGYKWVTQERNFPLNTSLHKHPTPRSYEQIKKSVLESVRVRRLDIDDDATFDYRSLHSEVRDLLTLLDSLGIVIHIATSVDYDLR